MTEPDRSHRYKSLAFHGPSTHGGTAHPLTQATPIGTISILSSFPTSQYGTKKAGPWLDARSGFRFSVEKKAPPVAEPHDVDQSRFGRDQMS